MTDHCSPSIPGGYSADIEHIPVGCGESVVTSGNDSDKMYVTVRTGSPHWGFQNSSLFNGGTWFSRHVLIFDRMKTVQIVAVKINFYLMIPAK